MGVRDRREREVLDQLLGLLHTIEISTKITQQAGLWRREYGKSHGTGIIDALIAACADALQIPPSHAPRQTLPDAARSSRALSQINQDCAKSSHPTRRNPLIQTSGIRPRLPHSSSQPGVTYSCRSSVGDQPSSLLRPAQSPHSDPFFYR